MPHQGASSALQASTAGAARPPSTTSPLPATPLPPATSRASTPLALNCMAYVCCIGRMAALLWRSECGARLWLHHAAVHSNVQVHSSAGVRAETEALPVPNPHSWRAQADGVEGHNAGGLRPHTELRHLGLRPRHHVQLPLQPTGCAPSFMSQRRQFWQGMDPRGSTSLLWRRQSWELQCGAA